MTRSPLDAVQIGSVNECWQWLGTFTYNGYGVVEKNKRRHRAHRFVYELVHGPLPAGIVLHHRCENRGCVNPKHLEPHTRRTHRFVHRKCDHPRVVHPNGTMRCHICDNERTKRRRATDPEYAERRRAYDREWKRVHYSSGRK